MYIIDGGRFVPYEYRGAGVSERYENMYASLDLHARRLVGARKARETEATVY